MVIISNFITLLPLFLLFKKCSLGEHKQISFKNIQKNRTHPKNLNGIVYINRCTLVLYNNMILKVNKQIYINQWYVVSNKWQLYQPSQLTCNVFINILPVCWSTC